MTDREGEKKRKTEGGSNLAFLFFFNLNFLSCGGCRTSFQIVGLIPSFGLYWTKKRLPLRNMRAECAQNTQRAFKDINDIERRDKAGKIDTEDKKEKFMDFTLLVIK